MITARETQTKRMIQEMKKRKMSARDFTKMGIMQYNARIYDIKAQGIQVESQNTIDPQGKVSRYKEYWIPQERSNFFTRRFKAVEQA